MEYYCNHHRRSIRLKGYDYSSAGAYFITICVQNRECVFGNVENGVMVLNDWGCIISDAWVWLESQYGHVELDEYVIMPNHLHGIVVIGVGDGRGVSRNAPTDIKQKPLGRLIGAFKTVSTKRINEIRKTPGAILWQRNYYEHIIRDGEALNRIRKYIIDNPRKWTFDNNNPARIMTTGKRHNDLNLTM